MRVDRSKLMCHEQHRLLSYSAEASELGLPPGQWPQQIVVLGLGNGLPFRPAKVVYDDSGEFGGLMYRQSMGCLNLTVFND
jgi:hypothetical protein